jgi:two-component system KDP operon response regulator KdpE
MMPHRKLLVIDDDPAIFRYLRRGLTREGYDVEAALGQGMFVQLDEWQPDVVLLGLTSTNTVSQIQAIKARSPAPLIGLVEEDSQATIDALDAGVDDCIAKPFGLEELAAHLRKVLRRDMWRRGETPCFETPTLRIDFIRHRIDHCGRALALSQRQFQLLKLLVDADGRVLTHRDLIHGIWGSGDRGNVALLRRLIQDLRRKIELDPKQPVLILSHSRIGYRFDRLQRRG